MEKKNCHNCKFSCEFEANFKGTFVRCKKAEELHGFKGKVKVFDEAKCGAHVQQDDKRDMWLGSMAFHCPACHSTGGLFLPHQVMGVLQGELDEDEVIYEMEAEGDIQTCPLCDGEGMLDELY